MAKGLCRLAVICGLAGFVSAVGGGASAAAGDFQCEEDSFELATDIYADMVADGKLRTYYLGTSAPGGLNETIHPNLEALLAAFSEDEGVSLDQGLYDALLLKVVVINQPVVSAGAQPVELPAMNIQFEPYDDQTRVTLPAMVVRGSFAEGADVDSRPRGLWVTGSSERELKIDADSNSSLSGPGLQLSGGSSPVGAYLNNVRLEARAAVLQGVKRVAIQSEGAIVELHNVVFESALSASDQSSSLTLIRATHPSNGAVESAGDYGMRSAGKVHDCLGIYEEFPGTVFDVTDTDLVLYGTLIADSGCPQDQTCSSAVAAKGLGALYSEIYTEGATFIGNGVLIDTADANLFGGALNAVGYGHVALYNTTFESNYAKRGGAVYVSDRDEGQPYTSQLDLYLATFVGNGALERGGAISQRGGRMTASASHFAQNYQSGAGNFDPDVTTYLKGGGAIAVGRGTAVSISRTSFFTNWASGDGGSILVNSAEVVEPTVSAPTGATLWLADSDFVGLVTQTSAQRGGAIAAMGWLGPDLDGQPYPAMVLQRTKITSTSAELSGGGVYVGPRGQPQATQVLLDSVDVEGTFAGEDGGALYSRSLQLPGAPRLMTTVFNSTFSTSQCGDRGGAIASIGLQSEMLIANSFFVNSRAGESGTEGDDIFADALLGLADSAICHDTPTPDGEGRVMLRLQGPSGEGLTPGVGEPSLPSVYVGNTIFAHNYGRSGLPQEAFTGFRIAAGEDDPTLAIISQSTFYGLGLAGVVETPMTLVANVVQGPEVALYTPESQVPFSASEVVSLSTVLNNVFDVGRAPGTRCAWDVGGLGCQNGFPAPSGGNSFAAVTFGSTPDCDDPDWTDAYLATNLPNGVQDADGDGVVAPFDCAPEDASVYPDAVEICGDGVDANCNNVVDTADSEAEKRFVYEDLDGDGYGSGSGDWVDCAWLGEGVALDGGDCDDGDPSRHPGAAEVCDGVDNDCDGLVDSDDALATGQGVAVFVDADGDGFGEIDTEKVIICDSNEGGYSAQGGDCDDADPAVSPNGSERCNGYDDDCNGQIDEGSPLYTFFEDLDGDGFGDAARVVQACLAPLDFVENDGDCNDQDPTIKPGSPEICDAVDNDCDGTVDVGPMGDLRVPLYADSDGDGFSPTGLVDHQGCASEDGFTVVVPGDALDCDDGDASVNPDAQEVCGGGDEDCDGLVDDEDSDVAGQVEWFVDADGDGFGGSSVDATFACAQPEGRVGNQDDCDDAAPEVYPGAEEKPNGVDDNCDGELPDDELEPNIVSASLRGGGCACESGAGGPVLGWMVLALGLVGLRRRRAA